MRRARWWFAAVIGTGSALSACGTASPGATGQFQAPAPKLLALDRDGVAPGETFHVIGQDLWRGTLSAWIRGVGDQSPVEAPVVAGPEAGAYPGLGQIDVLRVLVPAGAMTGDVVVQVGGQTSNALPFKVSSTSGPPAGGTGGGPPRIFILLPTSGSAFTPVSIGGTNFDPGAIPYFNSTPSVSVFQVSHQNLPLIGSIAVGYTIVPPSAPPGPGDVVVEYLGQRSNPFPFTVN